MLNPGMPRVRPSVAMGAAIALHLLVSPAFAQESDASPVSYCWDVYATCVEAAFGFEGWRTSCYSDLTACLAGTPVPDCTRSAHRTCDAGLAACLAQAGSSPMLSEDCSADMEACLMAHGC